jgi:hypothetical protein
MRNLISQTFVIVAALVTARCATGRIPNTDVPDTSENQAIVSFCERYRHAVEAKDTRTLLSLASPRYFEDGGTPTGEDDYGFEGLQRLLAAWNDEVREVRYEMRYRRITPDPQRPNRVFVDYTYTGSYTLRQPASANANDSSRAEDEPGARHSPSLTIDPVRGATARNEDDEVWFRRVADNRLELERVGEDWRVLSGM